MNERKFIKKLRERATEQEKIIRSMPLPKVFSSVSLWLGSHPWRILVPIALMITLMLHSIFGNSYDSFILAIFGKL